MNNYNILGIIGGVGPYAGLDMVEKIFKHTLAGKDQEHLPLFLASLPHEIAGRPEFLTGMQPINPGAGLAKVALMLEKAGVTHCAVPCNTAHAKVIWQQMLDELEKNNSQIKMLHILEELQKEIFKKYPRSESEKALRMGILATDGTLCSQLYQDYFAEKYQLVFPLEEEQVLFMDAIFNPVYGIKACSTPVHTLAYNQIIRVLKFLSEQDIDIIIFACSELSLILTESTYFSLPCIDPVNILACALISATYPEKLKE